jgi:DNA polymerase IV
MNRTIVHMDLDSFFVSVERLQNSSLNGLPVIIGGISDRGVVASCSYEARQFGVHSAMPAKMARQLCPQAIFIQGDYDLYSKYSNTVTEIIKEQSPVVEKASIDEHYLDISGMERYIKPGMLWAHELREKIIHETGLPISLGLATNKTVSKVATGEAKPNGEKDVAGGTEKFFLAPLSIKKIPGIGNKTFMLLRNMGIEKVQTIQQMPLEMMVQVLGENGKSIWEKSMGIDNTPVEPYSERKSISSEITFEQDTTDVQKLRQTLTGLAFKLAFQLRKERKVTGCITLKLRYTDFQTHTFQVRIGYTSSDHILIEKALELFEKNYSRRVLIRLIGIKFSHLASGYYQINLFEDSEEMIKLYQAMDRIRNRFGDDAIKRSCLI